MKDTIQAIADKSNIDFDTAKAIYFAGFQHCYTRGNMLTKDGMNKLYNDIKTA